MAQRQKNNKIKRMIVIAILIIIICYISYIVYILIKNPTNICVVKKGKIYEEESTVGYIIRDEVVIKNENEIIPIIEEGNKVAKNSSVFKFNNEIESDLENKILETELKIQEKIMNTEKTSSSDILLMEEDIDKKISKIRNTKNYKELIEYKKEIEQVLDNKIDIVEKLYSNNSEISNLINEKKQYENELTSNLQNVKSSISGVVSYRVDGLEEILTKEKFSEINAEFLEQLNIRTNQIIATSKNSGKVVNNFEGYIVTILNSENARNAKEGDKVSLRLYTNEEVSAQIEYINKIDDANIVIAFKVDTVEEELIKYRKMSFDVIWWSKEGLKIPNTAITQKENGLNYVTRNRSGYLTELLVKILVQNEDYSLITTYSTEELQQLNLTEEEISNYVKVKLFDEVVIN